MIEITQDPTNGDRSSLPLEPLFAVSTPDTELSDGTTVPGERIEYDHPVKYPPAVGLRYTHLSRTRGVGVGLDWLLGWALGADGHAALTTALGMTEDQLEAIVGAVVDKALGRASAPKFVD